MIRMRLLNKNLLFPEYRKRGVWYLIYMKIRYCMLFQLLFYSVMGNYFFLGSMDHLLARSGIISATNKDSIHIGRCTALFDVIRFNSGSWLIAFYLLGLAYVTILEYHDWDYTAVPDVANEIDSFLFAGPAALMATFAFFVPLILNPYVLGWPFNPPLCSRRKAEKKETYAKNHRRGNSGNTSGSVLDLHTFLNKDAAKQLGKEIGRIQGRPDVELGSLATYELASKYPMSVSPPPTMMQPPSMLDDRKKSSPGTEKTKENRYPNNGRVVQSASRGSSKKKKTVKLAMI